MPKTGIAPIRRQELIDAVLAIVSTEGWDGLTVRRVSALSGVAPGAIPHFLGTKADMVSEAIAHAFRIYQERVLNAIAAASTPTAKLIAWLDATVSPTADKDEEWGFWLAMWGRVPFDESIRSSLAPVYRVHATELADVVNAGIKAGDFRDAVDPAVFADQLIALLDGMVMRCRLDDMITPAYVRAVAATFIDQELGLIISTAYSIPSAGDARPKGGEHRDE
jgi:AcrR family transcriptional regulator